MLGAPEEAEQAKDVTPLEDDAQNAATDKVPDFVDPETGEIKASEGNLFDNLEDLA